MSEFKYVNPDNLGWLEYKLESDELNYVWDRIGNCSSESWKNKLAGDVFNSKKLEDPDDWFLNLSLIHISEPTRPY